MIAVSFKIQNRIDHMLQKFGACNGAVFGHMTDQQRWYAGFFGHHHQTDGGFPNLADASGG